MSQVCKVQGDNFKCFVLSDKQFKIPKYKMYYHRRQRKPDYIPIEEAEPMHFSLKNYINTSSIIS